MIEINLLPVEFQKKPKKDFKLPDLPYIRIFGVMIIVFAAVEALLFVGVLFARGGVASLENRLKKLSPDFERIKLLKLETSKAEADLTTLEGMTVRPIYWTAFLNAISNSITEDVWLTHVGALRKIVEFDMPKKKAPRDGGDEDESGASKDGNKAKPAVSPRRRLRVAETPKGRRVDDYIIIKGSAPVSGQGTAAVGRFIQSLKDNPVINEAVSDMRLDKVDRVADGTLFAFTVNCKMKKPFGDIHETF